MKPVLEGSARLELYFSKPVNLVDLAKVLAKYGLWSAKVLPREDGTFEISAPESLLLGYKPSEDLQSFAYKLYSSPDAKTLVLFGDLEGFKDYVAEAISFLSELNYGEELIEKSTLVVNVTLSDFAIELGKLQTDFLGPLTVNGLVASNDRASVALSPLGNFYLLTVTLSGPWREVRPKVMVLQPLLEEVLGVLKEWISQK